MGQPVKKKFAVIKSRRLYEQIAEQIAASIRSNQLKTGDRLPAERDLSVQLGVGRPAVREALIWLEANGLIQVRTGDGAFVRGEQPAELDLHKAATDPGPGPFEQIEARLVVEPQVAALSARRCSAEEIDQLASMVEEMRQLSQMGDSVGDVRYRFHTSLARMSGNSFLAAAVKQLWDLRAREMWRTLRDQKTRAGSAVQRLHPSTTSALRATEQIVEALRRRDAEGARWAMETIVRQSQNSHFSERDIMA